MLRKRVSVYTLIIRTELNKKMEITHLALLLLRRRLEMRLKKGFHHLHGSDLTFLKRLPKHQGASFIYLNAALHQFIFILSSNGVKT